MSTNLARTVRLAATLVLATGTARAQIFVDAGANDGTSWTDAYTELADALDGLGQNETIWVAAGRYTPGAAGASGPATTFYLPIGTHLFGGFDGTETSLAERAGLFDTTILSGDHLGDDGPDFTNRSDNSWHVVTSGIVVAEIDGFTVEGGHAVGSDGGAIYGPTLGSCPVRNCTFRANHADDRGGALFMTPSDVAGQPRFVQSLACGVPATVDIGAHERTSVQGTTSFCPQPVTSLGVPMVLTGPCFASATDTFRLAVGPVPASSGTFFFGVQMVTQPFGGSTICAGRRFLALPGQPNGTQLELDFTPGAALAGSSLIVQAAVPDGGALALSSAIVLTVAD